LVFLRVEFAVYLKKGGKRAKNGAKTDKLKVIYIKIYIYVYMERERETERENRKSKFIKCNPYIAHSGVL